MARTATASSGAKSLANPRTSSPPFAAWALLVAMVRLLLLVAAIPTNADPDLWGNLRFGLDILSIHRISTVDLYSFTQDVPWINHEWLAQVTMAIAYTVAGTLG